MKISPELWPFIRTVIVVTILLALIFFAVSYFIAPTDFEKDMESCLEPVSIISCASMGFDTVDKKTQRPNGFGTYSIFETASGGIYWCSGWTREEGNSIESYYFSPEEVKKCEQEVK